MSEVTPQGEHLRRAIKWVSDMRQYEPENCGPIAEMVERAGRKFDLTPKEQDFLFNFFCQQKGQDSSQP